MTGAGAWRTDPADGGGPALLGRAAEFTECVAQGGGVHGLVCAAAGWPVLRRVAHDGEELRTVTSRRRTRKQQSNGPAGWGRRAGADRHRARRRASPLATRLVIMRSFRSEGG